MGKRGEGVESVASASVTRKRVVLFAGHYGSGKTNIAISYARWLRRSPADGKAPPAVTVADLDIVNPYFRTKDSAATLAAEGIDLVVSEYANSNVDFPALPKEIYALVAGGGHVVMDIGGDDRGALALGRYVADLREGGDYEMVGVVNMSRPLTRTPEDAVEVLREIEAACRLPFTGIVNNTNLGPETTAKDVLDSVPYAEAVSRLMGVPVLFTCCSARLLRALAPSFPEFPAKGSIFPLDIQKLYYHYDEEAL